jgi:hypothetical protein
MRKGFARVNLDVNNGVMTIEARAADWNKLKGSVEKIVQSNLDGIDKLRISMLNRNADDLAETKIAPFFQMDTDAEKMAAIPFMNEGPRAARVTATDNPAFRAPEEGPAAPLPPVYAAPKFAAYDSTGKLIGANYTNYGKAEDAAGKGGSVRVLKQIEGQAQPYGYWISPEGEKKEVGSEGHDNRAARLIGRAKDESNDGASKDLFDRGWVRVVNDVEGDIFSDSRTPLTKMQRETLQDLAFEYKRQVTHNGRPTDIGPEITGQAQPKSQEDLFGQREAVSPARLGEMTNAEIAAHYPEAVIPRRRDEPIPSDIKGSPLYKSARDEDEAVRKFADKLVKFANDNKNEEGFKSGSKWYSEFVPMLKKNFGADAPIMAELLAATSPQNAPEANYAYALDALHGLKSGRFDKLKAKYEEGLAKLNDGTWKRWAARNELGADATPAAFLAGWIDKFNLKPRQSNGQLYGISSVPVLQVITRRWLANTSGPKTQNFVQNLLGTGHDATIDLWADRTMRHAGYADDEARWRILPKNSTGVSDADFEFSQKAFAEAAKQLKMKPDALQGALWFAEKQRWARNGWSRLDLGDYRKEVPKTAMLREGIEQRLARTQAVAKSKTGKQEALDLLAEPGDVGAVQAQPKQIDPFKKIAESHGANVDRAGNGFVVRVPHLAHGKSRDASEMHKELEDAGAVHVHDTILSPYANVTRYRFPEPVSVEPRNLK